MRRRNTYSDENGRHVLVSSQGDGLKTRKEMKNQTRKLKPVSGGPSKSLTGF